MKNRVVWPGPNDSVGGGGLIMQKFSFGGCIVIGKPRTALLI